LFFFIFRIRILGFSFLLVFDLKMLLSYPRRFLRLLRTYNTIPMMTGDGPFGSVEMGGMFSVLKVRKEQKAGDYSDPGWFEHPAGTVAYEWTGQMPDPKRFQSEGGQSMPRKHPSATRTEIKVRKPQNHSGH
jgi:hypothetical protein